MRIDAHHHFWKYDPVEYDWISDEMGILRRNFLPADLQKEIASAQIDQVISVQARQTLEETRWLLDFARENEFICGVVGWVPLISETVEADLERFAEQPKFKGIRHVLQGEPDANYMLRADFNRGIGALKPLNLAYDILIFERHLPQTIEFVDQHPEQIFILDHIAKPRIADSLFEPWNRNIRELAKRENVYCKLSGMVTEANWTDWNKTQLKIYASTVLEAFGAERTMFGSDWPVCLVANGYQRWVNVVENFIEQLSPPEQNRVFGETAAEAYRLKNA